MTSGKVRPDVCGHAQPESGDAATAIADWLPSSQSAESCSEMQRCLVRRTARADTGFGLKAGGGLGIVQGASGTPILAADVHWPAGPSDDLSDPTGDRTLWCQDCCRILGRSMSLSMPSLLALLAISARADPDVPKSTGGHPARGGLDQLLANGTDQESPDDARKRLTTRLQTPPKGGAAGLQRVGNSVTDANGVAYANLRYYGYSGGDANVGGGGGYDGPAGIM